MQDGIKITSWKTPFEPKGTAVVFDIFRCSTTIHCLAHRNPKKLWVASSLKAIREAEPKKLENMHVYSELSQEVICKHRYDNSPELAAHMELAEEIAVATTSGTPAMFAAKGFTKVYVGSFVNFSALVAALKEVSGPITLIPARLPSYDPPHIEDDIAAEAVRDAILGDENAGAEAIKRIRATGRVEELTEKLATGHLDTEIALDLDRFPKQVLSLKFTESPFLAEVVK